MSTYGRKTCKAHRERSALKVCRGKEYVEIAVIEGMYGTKALEVRDLAQSIETIQITLNYCFIC